MYPTKEDKSTPGTPRRRPDAALPRGAKYRTEKWNLCAYNKTRECFLALGVTDDDIRFADLTNLIATLALNSGEGLWIVPFRGIPATGQGILLDLVFLDENCRVIGVEESFLTSRDAPSKRQAASVLALPPHTIYSSQTQLDDQLVICKVEEIGQRLGQDSSSGNQVGAVLTPDLLMETPLLSGSPGALEPGYLSKTKRSTSPQSGEIGPIEPVKRSFKPPKNWLERWWSPDPRSAPREPVVGLAAYYWTGASPVAHHVRDISATGLYLMTEERWYPGTVVLMTLQRTDSEEDSGQRSIYVHSRAVRWGDDGVGLEFIWPNADDPRRTQNLLVDAVEKEELEEFLQRFLDKKKPGRLLSAT